AGADARVRLGVLLASPSHARGFARRDPRLRGHPGPVAQYERAVELSATDPCGCGTWRRGGLGIWNAAAPPLCPAASGGGLCLRADARGSRVPTAHGTDRSRVGRI